MKKAIVLGADNGYLNKLETTIKSVCTHNRNLKFYIFNDDLPSEWFQVMNRRLKAIDSEIINVKISNHQLKGYHLPIAYLSYATFFRYFIADFVVEEKALYLDSDIVVTHSLDELFQEELGDYWIAGVRDYFVKGYENRFNAGMMLINVSKWKRENLSVKLIELTNRHHQEAFGDQGILNMVFGENWKKLDRKYNFMVGLDSLIHIAIETTPEALSSWYNSALPDDVVPYIIHYTGEKPWLPLSQNRYRDIWWFYQGLEWSDILLRKERVFQTYQDLTVVPKAYTAIFTNSCELEQVEYLIENLSDVHFYIFAHTWVASNVIDLTRYPNVTVYQQYNHFSYDKVMKKLDFYLDINHYDEIDDITNVVMNMGKPVFSFSNTNHCNEGAQIFSPTEPEKMVQEIRKYIDKEEK